MRIKDREQNLVFGSHSRMPFRECEQGSFTNIKGSFADVQGEDDFVLRTKDRFGFFLFYRVLLQKRPNENQRQRRENKTVVLRTSDRSKHIFSRNEN